MAGTRQVARVAVTCTLAFAAAAAPAHAQEGNGLGDLVGEAVQQAVDALPLPAQQQGQPAPGAQSPVAPAPSAPGPATPAPAPPKTPAPAVPAPAAPKPAAPVPGNPAQPFLDASEPAPRSSPAKPAPSSAVGTGTADRGMNGPESRPTAEAMFGKGPSREPAAAHARDGATAKAGAKRARAKAGATRASASDAGDAAKASATQSGGSGGAAAKTEDPSGTGAHAGGGATETADPVATGAQATEESSGALPFTGFGISLLVVLGLIGLAGGLLLRRLSRRVTRAGA